MRYLCLVIVAIVCLFGGCQEDPFEECTNVNEGYCSSGSTLVECLAPGPSHPSDAPSLLWAEFYCATTQKCVEGIAPDADYTRATCVPEDQSVENRCAEICDAEANECPYIYTYCLDDEILHQCQLGFFVGAADCAERGKLCGAASRARPSCWEAGREGITYGPDAGTDQGQAGPTSD